MKQPGGPYLNRLDEITITNETKKTFGGQLGKGPYSKGEGEREAKSELK